MTKTTRIAPGLYEMTYAGRTFQIEDIGRASDGDCGAGWIAYEVSKHGNRIYLDDYSTKRAAIEWTVRAAQQEA